MMTFIDYLYRREPSSSAIAQDAENPEFEKKHPRASSGEKGGQFRTKPETIEKQDDLGSPKSPKPKMGFRQMRDAVAKQVGQDGTYVLATGKPISYKTGYQVSFQEETTEKPGHGAYIDDAEYDRKVIALSKELNAEPDLGYFDGEAEISFHVEDFNKAMEVARRHNQHSIYLWATHGTTYEIKKNPDFVGRTHYADRNNHEGKNYRAK